MSSETKEVFSQYAEIAQVETRIANETDFTCPVNPLKQAYLNFGLFGSLYEMGTSRERICTALLLSVREFDCIRTFVGFSK
jgi:hypothetical protein